MSPSTFAIVNLRDGLRRDLDPFLLDNDAFPILQNAYLFRGKLNRRSCFRSPGQDNGRDGRLKWQIGTTGVSPFAFTLPNIPLGIAFSQFTIGTVTFTDPGGASPVNLLSTDGAYSGTLDRATGVVSLAHPVIGATSVFYIPGLPVMGLRTREVSAINDERLLGFDTRYSYIFDQGNSDWSAANTFKILAPGVTSVFIWSGANFQQFWSYNYLGAFFATNNIPGLNAYGITAGTDAVPSVITITAGHNVAVGDIVMIANTNTSNTLNGRAFQVTVVAGANVTINNTVAPGGGAFVSGFMIVLNRQVNGVGTGGDSIKYFDGPGSGTGWVNFIVPLNSATPQRILQGALMCVAYKGRLLVLNTFESSGSSTVPVNFAQRARWSQNGTPFFTEDNAATPVEYLLPTNQSAQADAWFDATPGKGGFIDAPTNEAIVSAEFIKDTLVVFFERSTWQLVYTGNETLPFVFQKINTELGAESTFSVTPFDQGVFNIGNYGIVSCDSVSVERLDQKIPDEVFQMQNINDGPARASGIRDYNAQLVYWSYPTKVSETNQAIPYSLTFPNNVLIYNYLDASWAEFDDCFTCFGYFQQFSDRTWASLKQSWASANFAWNSQVTQARYPSVIAGNQRGFTMIFSQLEDNSQNSPSLEISDASGSTITCPDHNLKVGQFILITAMTGFTNWNGKIFKIGSATATTFDVILVASRGDVVATGYTGAGVITHMPNIFIQTKQFNPFYEQGDSVRLNYIDMLMDRTAEGEFTADIFTNSNTSLPVESDRVITAPENQPTYTTPSPNTTYQGTQAKIWHRIYNNAFGSFYQLRFSLSDAQMTDIDITTEDIVIHGLIFYNSSAGRVSYDI